MTVTAFAVPEEFAAVLAALSEAYQRPISDAQARIFFAAVDTYNHNDIRHGVMELIKTRMPGGGKPVLPLPAEVRSAVSAYVKTNTDTRLLPAAGACGQCNDGLVRFEQGANTMHRPCICGAGCEVAPAL